MGIENPNMNVKKKRTVILCIFFFISAENSIIFIDTAYNYVYNVNILNQHLKDMY